MKMTPKHIVEASPEERRKFAVQFLGLDIEEGASDEAVYAKIEAAHDSETIFVMEEPEPADMAGAAPPPVDGARETPEARVDRQQGSLGRDDPRVEITINNEERDGEIYSRDKEVGVNGVVWLLQRGKRISIPLRVFLALEAAVKDSITHDKNTGEVHSTKVKSVPYNVHSLPSQQEIAEWRARVAGDFCP